MYNESIILIDPVIDPRIIADEYNPLAKPEEHITQTFRHAFLWLTLAPWIECGAVKIIRSIGDFDYKLKKNIAWLLTAIVPITAYLMGVTQFIPIIGLVGAIAGGTEGVMIVMMHAKAKKLGQRKPEFSIGDNKVISIVLVLMFVVGMLYELIL